MTGITSPLAPAAPGPADIRAALDKVLQLSPRQAVDMLRTTLLWVYRSVSEARWKQVVAVDQDPESLRFVANNYPGSAIEPVSGSVAGIIKGMRAYQGFDLVSALGLYDYLSDRAAARLTANLFRRLKPGGELLVANFMPWIVDIGYLRSYMAWDLVFRAPADMLRLADEIEPGEVASLRTFVEPEASIVFLSIVRGRA